MRIPYLFLSVFFCAFASPSFSQTYSFLKNPSFEGKAGRDQTPSGWEDCSFPDKSPVDIHDLKTDLLLLEEFAPEGDCFIGMIFRDNTCYEGISTALLQPLVKDSTYRLSIKLKLTKVYQTPNLFKYQTTNYSSPPQLEIWGGNTPEALSSRLEVSSNVSTEEWTEWTMYITPVESITQLGLIVKPVNRKFMYGHILIDDLQLVRVDPVTLEELPD